MAVADQDDDEPTTDQLDRIEHWPFEDVDRLMAFVKAIWWPDNAMGSRWGWTQHGRLYRISTGGWSGNEEIIRALERNHIFWSLCWLSSRRGGHHEFEVPL